MLVESNDDSADLWIWLELIFDEVRQDSRHDVGTNASMSYANRVQLSWDARAADDINFLVEILLL